MKNFWLIGASSGIGEALAYALVDAGWKVAISSRNEDKLNTMSEKSEHLLPYPVDVTQATALKKTYLDICEKIGDIDCVMFNAGDYKPMSIEEFSPKLFTKLIEVNYIGAVNLLDFIIPDFTKRAHGQILLTASLAAYRGLPRSAPYSASKAALLSLAESLHLELKQHNVLLRVINPGFVKTPLTDKNTFKMPSLISPEDAAKAIMKELEGDNFEIRFPKGFARNMRLLSLLPYRLYFYLTKKAL